MSSDLDSIKNQSAVRTVGENFKTWTINETENESKMGPNSNERKGKTEKLMLDIEANDKSEFQLNGYLWQKVFKILSYWGLFHSL